MTISMASPSMTSACFSWPLPAPLASAALVASRRASVILARDGKIFLLIMVILVVVSSSWHANAMLIAVSSLSPVSTHTAMPARDMSAIAVGTPDCSLSSMAVEPSSVRSFSIMPISRSISLGSSRSFFSSSVAEPHAAMYSECHRSNDASSTSLQPSTSVRSPSLEWSFMCASVRVTSCSCPTRSSLSITLSAPLESSWILPVASSRRIVDMRLRADEKSSTESTVNDMTEFDLVSVTKIWSLSRFVNSKPKKAAAATSAASSGDAAESLGLPSTSSRTTVWHSASSRKNWRQRSACVSAPLSALCSSGPSKLTALMPPPGGPVGASSARSESTDTACPRRARRARPISVWPRP
mmetsp:Transcript_45694/g.120431  ORF Transcript_45694/g.120431 Transcript_45694/m.120431 type:complete len:355 (+) Transcript_45694:2095-3159(+)